MMRQIRQLFLSGLAVTVPSVLTVYAIWWIAKEAEGLFGPLLQRWIHESIYFPGMGVAATLLLILGIGVLARFYLVSSVLGFGERLLTHVPLVKTIFSPLKDMMNFFAEDRDEDLGRVVLFEWNGAQVVGFMTKDNISLDGTGEERIAVYLPMSYQIGGYTLLLPRDRVTEIDMSVEEGMRFAISAGVASKAGSSDDSRRGTTQPEGQAADDTTKLPAIRSNRVTRVKTEPRMQAIKPDQHKHK